MTREERIAPWAIWGYQCLWGIAWRVAYYELYLTDEQKQRIDQVL